MYEPVAWGVLGTATIARKCMIPAIQESEMNRVCVLGSRDPEAAKDLARKHDIRKIATGYDAVVTDPDVEAVYIPLPNHMHREWTLRALDAGKHVLCEKPLACSTGEAEEMAAAAADADRLLMEGFMYRFHPRSRRIYRMVADGQIGSLKLVRAAFCYRMDDEVLAAGTNFRLRTETGGGALMDVGCYGVSTARWFFGKEPISVQGQADYHPNGVDVHMVGSLKFEGGHLAVVEASFVSSLQQTYTLAGDRAVIEMPDDAYIPWSRDAVFSVRKADRETGVTISIDGADEYRLMVEHFANAVKRRTILEYHPNDSVRNMRVIDALQEAARSGKTIHMGQA